MTRVTVQRHTPRPTERAADIRRREIAAERVKAAMAGMLDGLDHETRMETCRTGIRVLAQAAKEHGGEGRASGVLCGALVDVAPAYRAERPGIVAAEALFGGAEDGEG